MLLLLLLQTKEPKEAQAAVGAKENIFATINIIERMKTLSLIWLLTLVHPWMVWAAVLAAAAFGLVYKSCNRMADLKKAVRHHWINKSHVKKIVDE